MRLLYQIFPLNIYYKTIKSKGKIVEGKKPDEEAVGFGVSTGGTVMGALAFIS